MNKLTSITRIGIILALGLFALLYLFGEELDHNLSVWILHVIIDKALAILAISIIVRLYKRWSKIDPWFIAYQKMCNEVD